ncbi:MAG TPA: NAD(P)/FAD-dependent oxidoreductase [Polyangiales bacterium]
MSADVDVIVVGSGPNGLGAAAVLARAGLSVRVLEAGAELGGGLRSAPLTLPGFQHDVCSAVHPMGALSPLFRSLPLEQHGLRWISPPLSAAHPLDDGPAALLGRSFDTTCATLGEDARAWRSMFEPLLANPDDFFYDILGPLRVPRAPLRFARFGLMAFRSARGLARGRFRGERARALFAGCAAHSVLPLDFWFTAALGVVFGVAGHAIDWPVPAGGSVSIANALAGYLRTQGVELTTHSDVKSLGQLPEARAYVFDTSPRALATIAAEALPARYRQRLLRYVYGPGCFKLDFALSGPIPWKDSRCAEASTVHVGGTLDEIHAAERAAWRGEHPERPFVMVCQQSHFDPTRAPMGKHTGYAYCHVPYGSTVDMSARIEAQIERFAPGFRDLILARHVLSPSALEAHNANLVGGAITGGAAHWPQLFTRPVARLDPYATPNPRVFLCSASTPPGGGVHGMGGYWAAQSVLRRLGVKDPVRV